MTILRYLLRINTEKHPKIQQKLDQQKGRDGVALYLRRLIEEDIEKSEKPAPVYVQPAMKEVAVSSEMSWPEPKPQNIPKQITPKAAIVEEEDFGGGLA